jgi:fatty acid desaturase
MSAATTAESVRIADVLSREEIAGLVKRSDLAGAWAIASTWAIIAAAFYVLATWPSIATFLVALIVIAGRQLALAILQHEASHRTLFETRWLNTHLANWLCARPVWQDVTKYRPYHLAHHVKAGTDGDPDLTLHKNYPVTRASLTRKFLRDIVGLTGLKTVYGLMLMDAEVIKWTLANDIVRLPGKKLHHHLAAMLRNMAPMLIANGVLFTILVLSGHAWLYSAWALAFITPLPFFVRTRSIAEHGALERVADVLRNTRTTRAGLLARMTVAPVNVFYHQEHHLLMTVPYFRLPQMHRLLRMRGIVSKPPGYWAVLTRAAVQT